MKFNVTALPGAAFGGLVTAPINIADSNNNEKPINSNPILNATSRE